MNGSDGELLQKTVCSRMPAKLAAFFGLTLKERPNVPKCASCLRKDKPPGAREYCAFKGFRWFKYDRVSNSFAYQFGDSTPSGGVPLNEVYRQPHSSNDVAMKQQLAATYLLPILLNEKQASLSCELTYRAMAFADRTTCDYCGTCIFSESYFCTICGQEWCYQCTTLPVCCHDKAMLIRLTRFKSSDLEDLIRAIQAIQGPIESVDDAREPRKSRTARCYLKNQLSQDKFTSIWKEHIPIVVKDVDRDFQTLWTPDAFSERFGEMKCEVEDCESGEVTTIKLREFFSLFGKARCPSYRSKKLKDWPPKNRFRELFPKLYQDFETALPIPSYTTSSGVMNLASHYPENQVAPDLGPKMYNALSTSHDDEHSGSTRLHLDLSDAVNILMWASTRKDGQRGYALWHIFAVEDAPLVRQYLYAKQREMGTTSSGDPIHNQETYLTPTMLQELSARHGVRPYTIRQGVGDAVFIPAGCAHQVSNQADCIKIACDFISPESVPTCKRLAEEFREQRLACGWPEDVIPFQSLLYYTWMSVDLTCRTMRAQRPPRVSNSGVTIAKPYRCPLCPTPGHSVMRVHDSGMRFAYLHGLFDHLANIHRVTLSKKVKRHCRKLPVEALTARLARYIM